MTRHPRPLPLLLALLALAAPAAAQEKGTPAFELGCAVARAVDNGIACAELKLYSGEGERRMGEELAQILDDPTRTRALQVLDAELAEKATLAGACPAARPLCGFPRPALSTFKEGLVFERK